MTTPIPAGGQPSEATKLPLRTLTAWALLLLAAAIIAFGFLHWIFPSFARISFVDRLRMDAFINIWVLVAPLLAMLVLTKLGPPVRGSKLLGAIALGIYAAALLFGVVAFLVGIAGKFDSAPDGFYVFGYILQGLGAIVRELLMLALTAVAALWTYRIFVGLGGSLPRVNVQTD